MSRQSDGTSFFIRESSFLNRFLRISLSFNPLLILVFIKSFVANISYNSLVVGSPIYSVITLARLLVSSTSNILTSLLQYFKISFRNTIPADHISIFVS